MRTTADRIRQALSFEILGLIIVTPLFAVLFKHPMSDMGVVVLVGATAATFWNYAYNLLFDKAMLRWRGDLRKTVPLRIVHAVLFEVILLLMLLPFFAWWLAIPILDALMMDIAFALFYMGYAFVFTWLYELIFPQAAPVTDKETDKAQHV
ncbi:PACE efflux transporter [Albirhodobacter sp. R86504]|jgi:uncharacterized membrane protein|uniref:PACE efflux transporter n=1 Tax=Albirhodobacter sp. R86504 TaxID=3093848 RepID=UPI00366BC4DD